LLAHLRPNRSFGRAAQRFLVASLVLFGGWTISLPATHGADGDAVKLPPASSQTGLTYAKDIQPILAKNCFGCHGPKMQKGRLRLDSLEAVLKGGEDGKIVEKGNSAKSSLVKAVARLSEDSAMPPKGKGNPLSKEEVGLIRAWIDQGIK
jgi:hypothetical protein